MSKPLSPEAKEAANEVMRQACERMERRMKRVEDAKTLEGVLAALDEQPREA